MIFQAVDGERVSETEKKIEKEKMIRERERERERERIGTSLQRKAEHKTADKSHRSLRSLRDR
jgi:hypothetical protein